MNRSTSPGNSPLPVSPQDVPPTGGSSGPPQTPSASSSPSSSPPPGSSTTLRAAAAAGTPGEKPAWVGKRIGRFRLVSLIGSGSMGRVFRAEDAQLQRHVALKVIVNRPERGRRATDNVDALMREARSAARLDHPGVVTVYDVGGSGEIHYIAMELVEGGNLDDLVRAGGPLDVQRACQVCAEAAEALQYAHECGIVHRDVKPANLMLTRTGRCKLGDFGLARLDDPNDSFALHGPAVGTPLYAAPEVIRHEPASAESDVYSLGATLFHLLTGQPPFNGRSASEVMEKHLSEVPPDVRVFRPDVTEDLADLVARALSKRPMDRFESAGQMAAVLRMQTIPVGLVGSASTTTLPQLAASGTFPPPAAPAPRRRWTKVLAASAAATLIAVGSIVVYDACLKDRQTQTPPAAATSTPRAAPAAAATVASTAKVDSAVTTTAPKTVPVLFPAIIPADQTDILLERAKQPQETTVQGTISSIDIRLSSNACFINFVGAPQDGFYVYFSPTLLDTMRRHFPGEKDLSHLTGLRVRVQGTVTLHKGRPQIKLYVPNQLVFFEQESRPASRDVGTE